VTSVDDAREDETRPRQGRHPLEYLSMVYRWRWPVAGLALLGAAVGLQRALATPATYQATARLHVARNAPQVLEFREVLQADSPAWGDEYILTQLRLLEGRGVARRAVERLRLEADPEFGGGGDAAAPAERAAERFAARVSARRVDRSQLIAVTFESGRPEMAARGANAAAELFVEQAVSMRAEAAADAAAWLGTEIVGQRKRVEAAEQALQRLAEETGIVSFEERRMLLDQKLKQLGTSLNEAKARRLEAESLARQMREVKDPQDLRSVRDSRVFQELRVELERLEQREAALLGGRYLEQHPEVVKVRAEIVKVRERVALEAERALKAAEYGALGGAAQEAALTREVDAAKAEALDLHRRGFRYEALKRDLEAGQAVLGSLLARSKQTEVAQALRASSVRVVDPAAVPRRPVRPRPRRDATLGFLLGLAAGVAAALLWEHFDTRLKTPRDVRVRLGAPLLAVVPEQEGVHADLLVLREAGRSGAFAESYRVLRSALELAWPGAGSAPSAAGRVIAVVSTAPREGKSVTAVNLALTLAARGEPVLLVEGDLRRPQVEQMLAARRSPGLTDVLSGVEPLDALQAVEGTRLRVLASGSPAASPSDLLDPAALSRVLAALRGHFRWIVLDTAPLGVAPDALGLAAASDGVVLVVGAEMVHEAAVSGTLERLRDVRVRVLGAVLSRARVERYPYDYGARFGHYSGHYSGHYAAAAEGAAAERPNEARA
jgi:capsular exopolysaccharide synthesis family protein